MRLLVVINLFSPDRGGGASVFTDMCIGLQARGVDVMVLAAQPYYPEWRRKTTDSVWRRRVERVGTVSVLRHGTYVPRHPSRLIPRMAFEASFLLSLLRSVRAGGRFDAIMVFCPTLSSVMFTSIRSFLTGERVWLNVQDIPADAAASTGISRSGTFNWLAQRVQRALFNRAEVWSTISPIMVERLRGLADRGQPTYLCPNWLNGTLAKEVARLASKVGRLPKTPPRLLYAGNIGKKQGLLEFCQSLARSNAEFSFQIHGNGGEADSVREWVEAAGDSRFAFGAFLDERGFAQVLHDCDVFVITERSGSGASFIPSKLIPCIASGTPVLAICDASGPLGHEVISAGLGTVVSWDDEHDFPEAVQSIGTDTNRFLAWQGNCVEHSRQYQADVAISRIHDLLKEWTGAPDNVTLE